MGGNTSRETLGRRLLGSAAVALALLLVSIPATAQVPVRDSGPVIDGPPPPLPPDVISRDASGRATVRAVRVSDPLTIDGTLDERVYQDVPAAGGFIQQEPTEGAPATERTEIWVLFDDENVYVSGRCWDSAPESQWIANEMRRDSFNIGQNEFIDFLFDTFYDRRNAVEFTVNPLGGRMDSQITDERSYNLDWNPVWEVRTGRFENGWTFEAAVPFRSIRYRPGRAQVWGLNVQRQVRWKNELSSLNPLPASRGLASMSQISLSATLVGLEAPEQGNRSLDIKPFVVGDLTSDRGATPPVSNVLDGDIGLDVKYGITENLVADVTVNTDFAQVEADLQQVNLTRFSLFFPEKREFFLENQGTFAFGGIGANLFFGGGGNTPILFYSRRIGLNEGREVPISAGGRLTGRLGAVTLGGLNIQTGDEPISGARSTNFTVVRIKGDVLRRSSVGAIYTRRSRSASGADGSNQTYGFDGTFAFYDNLFVNTYWARTETRGLDDDVSYRAQLDYTGDRYGVEVEHIAVGSGFNPEVGFLRRDDFERTFGSFRFSPRPQSIAAIRKFSWGAQIDYITDRTGLLETREAEGSFGIELENGDDFDATYTRSYEFLERPFHIAPGITIPVGGYSFQDLRTSYSFGGQRRLAGRLSFQHGGFFSGDLTSAGFTGGRLEVTPRLSIEPSLSLNWVDLPEGSFTTELVTARTTLTITPLMFVSALVQYNSRNDSLGANIRLRWEYQPGSELFVVYNEQRDTLASGYPELENRAFIIKINRLFRF